MVYFSSGFGNRLPSKATKIGGYGNVPGYGKVSGTYKPIGSGIGGHLTNALSTSLAANAIPTFTAQTPTVAAQAAAQKGSDPQLSNAQSGSGVAVAAHNDPRDPTYWTDVAKIQNTFDTNNAQYNLQQTQGQTALNASLAKLDYEQPIQQGNARGNYNNAGLFYSSRLGGALGDINHNFDTARTDARTGFQNLVNQLNIYRNQNQSMYGRDAQGNLTGTAYLDALNSGIGRATAADQEYAQANLLAQLLAAGQGGGGDAAGTAAPVQPIPAATASYPQGSKPIGATWSALSGIGRRRR